MWLCDFIFLCFFYIVSSKIEDLIEEVLLICVVFRVFCFSKFDKVLLLLNCVVLVARDVRLGLILLFLR